MLVLQGLKKLSTQSTGTTTATTIKYKYNLKKN